MIRRTQWLSELLPAIARWLFRHHRRVAASRAVS